MSPDQLTALAARLLNHAAMHDSVVPNDDELRQWRDDLIAAAEYLRQCAPSSRRREAAMLSDDDIQRVAIQCDMKSGQHWNRDRMNTSKMRSFARAIEREVRRQALEDAAHPDAVEALRMALDALSCTGESHDPGHRCTHCDEYVDRNSVVRKLIRAVLAAQGGNDAL